MIALWDCKNWLLSHYDKRKGIPIGMDRLTHEAWTKHDKDDIDKSDFSWEQYVEHVERGDGDDWFFECDHPPVSEWEPERPRAVDTADYKVGGD